MLETKRLLLLPISNQDFSFLKYFYAQPECTEYIPSPTVSIDILIQNRVKHWSKYGISTYSVRLNNEVIDYCGIEYLSNSQDADIRFEFNKSFWGHGYAQEAAKACIEDVFNSNRLERYGEPLYQLIRHHSVS